MVAWPINVVHVVEWLSGGGPAVRSWAWSMSLSLLAQIVLFFFRILLLEGSLHLSSIGEFYRE